MIEMMSCQYCNYENLYNIIDLGSQPICNKFHNDPDEFEIADFYPLELMYCRKCHLVQLSEVPPLNKVFGPEFNYLSGSTTSHVDYFQKLSTDLIEKFDISESDYVVDIGSNDGSFLQFFKERGINVLGIEPAPNPAEVARAKGIDTIVDRFEDSTDSILTKTSNNIRLITGLNVLAHTDTINEFMKSISNILSKNEESVFINQSHYLPGLIENLQYDTIYHEHARYYTLSSMKNIFERYNMDIFDVKKVDYYGGSILSYATRSNGEYSVNKSVDRLLREEKPYRDTTVYEEFSGKVRESKLKLVEILKGYKQKGCQIVGVGAPMKSTTLLNYCNTAAELIDYVTEVNELKIGRYVPGTDIRVVEENKMIRESPEAALILSWNVSDEIIDNLKSNGYEGDFIIPIPEPKVITQ